MTRRLRDTTPIPQDHLRRDQRVQGFCFWGTALSLALMLAHMAGVGL